MLYNDSKVNKMISEKNKNLLLGVAWINGNEELDADAKDILLNVCKEDNVSFEEVKEYFDKCTKDLPYIFEE
jgi:hypothetical protein